MTISPVPRDAERYRPIGDYALIGDCHSSALVSSEASIDWACLRRFDNGSTFARLLDHDRGGHCSIRPAAPLVRTSRRYRPNTMVLETTMETTGGAILVTDAFAMDEGGAGNPSHQLLRTVECLRGTVEIAVEIRPRFDFGGARPWLRRHPCGSFSATAGDDALVVRAGLHLAIDGPGASIHGTVDLREGDRSWLVLVSQPAYMLDPEAGAVDVAHRIDEAAQWWERWSTRTIAEGPHAPLLIRSALVLKSLCCAPTGAIVAAPTTSLPEVPGGTANWDYRACWIRDATLTLAALAMVGHHDVADGFRDFVMRSAGGDATELQIMYGPYGERRLPEIELDLEGWRCSTPVRTGNAAAGQVQLDVYGHLVDAVHLWHTERIDIDADEWQFVAAVVEQAIAAWKEPDAGIWELRGPPRHHVHSKVMAWVAVDRGIRLVQDHGFDGVDLERWMSARDDIREAVESRGVHPSGGYFVAAFDSEDIDASLLQLALVGFVDPDDERMIETVAQIRERLAEQNGFIRRFPSTGSGPSADDVGEATFLLCTTWLIEVLAMQGRIEEANMLFEELAGVANDVGLFAEEYSTRDGQLLGNFPQAFSHLGFIAAHHRLHNGATAHTGRFRNKEGTT